MVRRARWHILRHTVVVAVVLQPTTAPALAGLTRTRSTMQELASATYATAGAADADSAVPPKAALCLQQLKVQCLLMLSLPRLPTVQWVTAHARAVSLGECDCAYALPCRLRARRPARFGGACNMQHASYNMQHGLRVA